MKMLGQCIFGGWFHGQEVQKMTWSTLSLSALTKISCFLCSHVASVCSGNEQRIPFSGFRNKKLNAMPSYHWIKPYICFLVCITDCENKLSALNHKYHIAPMYEFSNRICLQIAMKTKWWVGFFCHSRGVFLDRRLFKLLLEIIPYYSLLLNLS